MRPNLRKVALMQFPDGGYTSPECYVICVRKDSSGKMLVDPSTLAAILRSDFVYGQIMHLIAGIGRPRLNATDMRKIMIPLAPMATQDLAREEFQGQLAAAREMKAQAAILLEQSGRQEAKAVEDLCKRLLQD
jgi:hypothetical protein